MGIISRLFGSHQARPKAAQPRTPSAAPPQPQRDATRRQLLVTALRDILRTHGIPSAWVTAETLTAATTGRQRGMHLRLILRDHRLLEYAMDIQKSVSARIARLDPLSPAWVAGISWRLEAAEDACFMTLPDPGHWQRLISNPGTPVPAAARAPQPEQASPAATARVVLDRLFAQDGPLSAKPRQDRPDFSATQPMEHTSSSATR